MFPISRILSTLNSKKRHSLIAAALVGSITTIASILVIVAIPQRADACRDCPFPMKIAENRWLMPDRQIEVQIVEIDRGRYTETIISVVNATSREVLASGSIQQRKGRRYISVSLMDINGEPVQVEIQWMDDEREKVRIFLSCGGECSLNQLRN